MIWGMSREYEVYCELMRRVGMDEMIQSMGESRVGTEHTEEHDAQWHQPQPIGDKVLVVDLDTWQLTGANHGALFFERVK